MSRVWEMLERSRRSLRDGAARQRLEGSTRQLLQRSRETVAQIIGSPPREPDAQEVLAGVCSSVALRDLNLVDSLLEHLEQMEADEDDPDALDRLYKLDHLATRLRRNGENLRVLAGRDAGSTHAETSSMVDVIRAGLSSIEHYSRVELGKISPLGVVGFAGDDISRLLAELLDNATVHSPPSSTVTVSAHLTEQGSMMIRIEDSGIGLPAARLSVLNERLASAPTLDRNAVRHMGLAVVRRLSAKHDVRVWLSRRAPHGTMASVLLPPALLQEGPVPAERKLRRDRTGESINNNGTGQNGTVHHGPAMSEPADSPAIAAEPVWPSEEQAVAQQHQTQPPTTANGLPRRVSQSLKGSSTPKSTPPEPPKASTEQDVRESHQQLLHDLGAFTEGEQAALEEQQDDNDDAERPEQ